MKTQFVPTNEYYHRILDAPGDYERKQLYFDLFVQPWKPMMDMMHRQGNSGEEDPLDGARAWAWLLPDQVAQMQDLLARMEEANAWEIGRAALAESAARFHRFAVQIPFDTITGWLVLADPVRSNPFEHGYTGATDWMQPRFIGQYWEPDENNLARLPGLIAHEMHHLIRLKAFPWGAATTVADYIMIEGTAEAFAASLYGEDRVEPFITEFSPEALETARRLIGQALEKTGFDVIRSYIFGDELAERSGFQPAGGMPTYGGYVVGYGVVQAFMQRSGLSIEEVTFLPAQEIIQGSGFFEA